MHSSRTLRGTGWLRGLSLVALGIGGCGETADDSATDTSAVASTNGLAAINGLSSTNGLAAMNGLAAINGLNISNGLAAINGLAAMNGLMTTTPGRTTVEYLVRCALPASATLVKQDQNGANYTFKGSLGLAPGWQNGACDMQCQEYVSACMMAHINTAGVHIPLWIVSQNPAVGWTLDPAYPNQEGTFFGNIFTTGAHGYDSTKVAAFYCNGVSYDVDTVPGRIGAGATGAPYIDPYLAGPYGTGVSGYCSDACTPADNPFATSGFKACSGWNNAVTTYRQAATGGTITTTSPTGLTATISKYDEKKDKYCANINLKNNTASTITAWTVVIDTGPSQDYKRWGDDAGETVASTTHTVKGSGHNAAVPAGATRSFGYCMNYGGSSPVAPVIKSVSTP